MSALVKSLVEKHAAEFSVDPSAIYGGGKGRPGTQVVMARRAVIASLWDRNTRGYHGGLARFSWDLSQIGRALRLNHTSVRHALIKSGMYGAVK